MVGKRRRGGGRNGTADPESSERSAMGDTVPRPDQVGGSFKKRPIRSGKKRIASDD